MWKTFWQDLNIRKAMAVIILTAYITYIFVTGQDLGIKDVSIMIISYYFGYSNGTQTKTPTD